MSSSDKIISKLNMLGMQNVRSNKFSISYADKNNRVYLILYDSNWNKLKEYTNYESVRIMKFFTIATVYGRAKHIYIAGNVLPAAELIHGHAAFGTEHMTSYDEDESCIVLVNDINKLVVVRHDGKKIDLTDYRGNEKSGGYYQFWLEKNKQNKSYYDVKHRDLDSIVTTILVLDSELNIVNKENGVNE